MCVCVSARVCAPDARIYACMRCWEIDKVIRGTRLTGMIATLAERRLTILTLYFVFAGTFSVWVLSFRKRLENGFGSRWYLAFVCVELIASQRRSIPASLGTERLQWLKSQAGREEKALLKCGHWTKIKHWKVQKYFSSTVSEIFDVSLTFGAFARNTKGVLRE